MSWFPVSVERNIASAIAADAARVAIAADAARVAIAADAALSCSCLSSMCCCRVG